MAPDKNDWITNIVLKNTFFVKEKKFIA